jgi:hypothetical protein
MDLEDTGWGGMDWIVLPRDRDKWRAVVKVANENCGSMERWQVL